MTTYKIIRFHQDGERRVLRGDLTLEEAREHCNDPDTSSRTCSVQAAVAEAALGGTSPWFDGYEEE